jgi:dephospho-CoA kinase
VDAFLHDIVDLLIRLGPWIVFVVTATETAMFLGLLVPAEATVLVAAFLANAGYFDVQDVLLATLAGGFIGDQIGYLLGRASGRRASARDGRLGRLWRRHEARATLLFRQRSILAVTLARFISFVRTLMPWFAGMTGMPYGRFLLYDLIGVLGWGIGSVAAGYMAGRSWHVLAEALGTLSTIIVVVAFTVLVVMAVLARRRRRATVRVAVTGNIASGKSAVTDLWKERGAVVIDADELARRVVEPGTSGLREVVRTFGRSVLSEDGTLDRAALRRRVFGDDKKRRQLESILHPEIERQRQQDELRAVKEGHTLVVHAIPLLYETGMDDRFDAVVLVDAPEAVRKERVVRTRGLSEEEADEMIAAQMPAAEKRARAHYIIDNDAGLDQLVERASAVWAELEGLAE